jgi:hypothetical protein
MVVGKTPSEVGSKPDLEKLYYKEDFFEFEAFGIRFKCRDIGGAEIFAMTRAATDKDGKMDQEIYAKELLKAVIIEPKIDWSRDLRGVVRITLVGEVEELLGLTEMARKKQS